MVIKISSEETEKISRRIPIFRIIEYLDGILKSSAEGKIRVTDVISKSEEEPYEFHLELETEDVKGIKVRKIIDETKPWKDDDSKDASERDRIVKKTLTTFMDSNTTYEVEGDYITDTRTGVVGALAASYLIENPKIIAIVGAGKVPRQFAKAAEVLFKPDEIRFATRSESSRKEFERFLLYMTDAKISSYDIYNSDHRKDLLKGADILFEAAPLRKDNEDVKIRLDEIELMKPNAHISSMTGDGMQHNFNKEVLLNSIIIVDNEDNARKLAELRHLKGRGKVVGTLAEASMGRLKKYSSERTFYDSSGNAPLDRLIELVVREYEGIKS